MHSERENKCWELVGCGIVFTARNLNNHLTHLCHKYMSQLGSFSLSNGCGNCFRTIPISSQFLFMTIVNSSLFWISAASFPFKVGAK